MDADPDRAPPQDPAAASSAEMAAGDEVKTEIAGCGAEAEQPAPARAAAGEAEPGGAVAPAAGRVGEAVAEASASEPTAEATSGAAAAAAVAAGEERPAAGDEADGGGGGMDEGRADVLAASEVAQGGIAGGSEGVDPAVSEARVEVVVNEGGEASERKQQQQRSPAPCVASEVDVGSDLWAALDLAPVVTEVEMEVDGGGVREQDCRGAAEAPEVEVEVEVDGGVVREQEYAGAAGPSKVKEEVGGGRVLEQECAGAAVAGGVKMVGADGRVVEMDDSRRVQEQDCAGAAAGVSEVKMEVDDSHVHQEQECAGTAVAGEVQMEETDGRVVDQGPAATSAGGLQVRAKEAGECLVGRYVGRNAPGHAAILIGKVSSYDSTAGVYGVVFEDGHAENLSLSQVQEFLMPDENGALGMKVSCRKRKLDLLVLSGSASEVKEPASTRQRVDGCEVPANPDALQNSGSGSDMSEDIESSSNSSDFTREEQSELCPPVQAVELPPSSGDIPVPEDSISYLFSVYNFLRSFSVQLFLSPFGLDDFVAAINCAVQNNLLDAMHVSLLRALKRHLESKSAEGSQMASNCLKYLDWTLLDALTWPTFLREYLYVTRCMKNLGGKSFARRLLAAEYYKLPVATKLRVLQILCDHVLESEEFKTVLDDRVGYNEEMEYGIDYSTFLEAAGSRAVSTRASKASAYKMMNDSQNFESAPNVRNPDVALADVSQDGNSDDCRICGMDGTLVCCDGCPWAYHSRCIGQNKAFLPHGDWFCPECVVNKLGPTSSRIERGARGAQMFGIDMCGRLFLGTCNYLLVIETSSDVESYARYYNHYDVDKVLQRLAPSDAYVDICRQIMEYWKHLPGRVQSERSTLLKEVGTRNTPQSSMLSFTPPKSGDGSGWTTLKDVGDSKTVALSQANAQQKFVANQYTVCSAEHLEKQKCMSSLGVVTEKNVEVCKEALSAQNNIHNAPRNGNSGPFVPSSISHQNGSVGMGMSNIAQAQPAHSIYRPDLSTAAKGESFRPSLHDKHHLQLFTERSGNMSCGKAAKLSSFKPQAYMNLYNHGNIAASAAANLAVITSDEGKVSASQLTLKPKRKVAADNALQLKAFSSAVAQFVWPSTEKKVMEVPRDRCGWCLACRSSASGNKKACFLNMTTANAAKSSARVLSTMRVIKNSDSHFASIAAYLANMEESLRTLLVGSLQDVHRRERWRQQLEEASNCRTLIPLLLELESNIRGVAFSASWLKPIDDFPVESPGPSTVASRPAQYQKRGAGGRRGRRRVLASESGTATDDDNSWTWWAGGNIIKRTLKRGALLLSTIRKAALQGGRKRIAGLSYHEGSSFPRRSKQLFWRACVGLSKTSSQLALQVRYLDAHIRWKEFIPPDQIPSDGKSSDADFSALRNAVLCDKKIVDNKIRYALKFPNQKHLPVRLTKNILEAEGDQDDESRKLWFSENHVPLYMLREFEQHAEASSLPTPGFPDSNCFTNLYPRRVKAFDGDVFSYLFHKGEVYPCASCQKDVLYRDIVKCSSCQGNCHEECTSRSVVSKGGSTTSSLICKLCLQKQHYMLTSYNKNTNASYIQHQPKSNGQQPVAAPRILFKVTSSHSAEPAPRVEAEPVTKVKAQAVGKVEATTQPVVNVNAEPLVNVEAQPLAKVATQNITSVKKTKAKKSKSEKPTKPKKVQPITYFGLVWKKNKNDKDDGSEFRANNVILKSKDGIGSSIKPKCCQCDKAYSPDFLYVRCEKCTNWFHGDSLQLDEDRLGELIGFRCCRCRRRAIPPCPHSDNYVKPAPELSEQAVATSSLSTMLSSEETFALANQDPLLASYGIVEPIGEETRDTDISVNTASIAPGSNQKLSIRRAQTKISEYLDQAGKPVNEYYIQNTPSGNGNINFSHMNEISFSEADSVDASELLGWDFSNGTAYAAPPDFTSNHQQNDTSCGSFVMDDFEPQTYFSFTELLEADDTQLDNAFGIATGLQDGINGTGSIVQQGVGFDDVSFMVEDGASNMNFPANDPTPEEVACQSCMHTQPPPDLRCSVCGLRIHRHCSPWDQGVEPVESSNWSCGGCRQWQ